MKRISIVIMLLLTVMAVSAQGKDARIKEIRAVYAQAKKKIEQNGKGANSPKDMRIELNHLDDEDVPLYNMQTIDFYFDETYPDGVAVKHPYFIVENWSCHGHTTYTEILVNPKDQKVMFCFMRGETDGGFVVESRYYYDTKGKCIEAKHNTHNSWTSGDSQREEAEFFLKVFNKATYNGYFSPLDKEKTGKTTPKAQRLAKIRTVYAQAKDKIAKNEKEEMPNNCRITTHDLGVQEAPRTTVTNVYFDKTCYFISEQSTSMMRDAYSEYLFDPQSDDIIFTYCRSREEGEEWEWRYYFDENGKCIETKTNSEETDDGFYDKRAARDIEAIFNLLFNSDL